jgi:hypothetical protein
MRNRVGRGFIALSTVLALLMVFPASAANAGGGPTTHLDDRVCSMYVNSIGFGAYCSSGTAGGTGYVPPTWKERLGNNIFIPCRDFPIPKGIQLGAAPEGKSWVFRVTIVDYDLNSTSGGKNVHLERMIVPIGEQERDQCRDEDYMDQFWATFDSQYPPPALQVKPTYSPRVNVPAYFSLTRESSYILNNQLFDPSNPPDSAFYENGHNLTMRGLVEVMTVDPGDGTPAFKCPMGATPLDDADGYDETKDPNNQMSTCKHIYKRSSASQPDAMYTVKLTITWKVSYWKGQQDGWIDIGRANVSAVQRLPVQEVQAIGG